jgi:broad specificity phosphatase PhoE
VEQLAQRLAPVPIRAVYTSPLARAVETAQPIAARHGLEPEVREELGEFRFGEWEGMTFDALAQDALWQRFNADRSRVRAPGGELMVETQTRLVTQLESLREQHAGDTIAIVSHGDPLRSAVAHYLGIPLDFMLRFEISPASVTVIANAEWGVRVLCLNQTGDLPL